MHQNDKIIFKIYRIDINISDRYSSSLRYCQSSNDDTTHYKARTINEATHYKAQTANEVTHYETRTANEATRYAIEAENDEISLKMTMKIPYFDEIRSHFDCNANSYSGCNASI